MLTRAQAKAQMETRAMTRAVCEQAWTQGMPLKITSDGFPIIMKPSMNCEYRVQGTQDIAYVGLPKTKEEVLAFLETIPRLSVRDLHSAPEGVYTWLLYSTEGGPPQFVASKTETMLELGTVHYSIAMSVGATRVHGAGELWKHGTAYTVNFLSGTFMQSWVLPEPCTLKIMERFIRNKLMTEVLPAFFRGKTLTFSDSPFVADRFLKDALTTDKLEAYVRAGFTVCIHDVSNKAECKSTKGTCKKPVTLEQMKGGKIVTLNAIGEEVPANDPSAVKRFDTNTYKELPLGGRRKTKTGKKARRKTRRRYRGGEDVDPSHVGVRMAESLVGPKEGPPPPVGSPPPLQAMFRRLEADLKLRPFEVDRMMRVYSKSVDDRAPLTEADLRAKLLDLRRKSRR
jgi:hypothetical protein